MARASKIIFPQQVEREFPESSFLACEKDTETILTKLFVEDKVKANYLKRLLVINTPDCLERNVEYDKIINSLSFKDLKDKGYIVLSPKILYGENEEIKSTIHIIFTDFMTSMNPYYRDCTIEIDVFCHPEYWDIGNFRLRPLKIVGYIDAILNQSKLSGIGTLNFLSCQQVSPITNLAGYCLKYITIHGNDDKLEEIEDEET
jgi:hypothetical protein